MSNDVLLPGLPADAIYAALDAAAGNERKSGKLLRWRSSTALAVNAAGWFLDDPASFPAFPPLKDLDWPATRVDLEREMRFPFWSRGNPWLDIAVETDTHLIGVESKRLEPFDAQAPADFSPAYDKDVWGPGMTPWTAMRDELRLQPKLFRRLNAAQLVKHSLGLLAEARRRGRRPVLVYLYAEPALGEHGPISQAKHDEHRREIARFATAIRGADVRFEACSYREWLDGWAGDSAKCAAAVIERFEP